MSSDGQNKVKFDLENEKDLALRELSEQDSDLDINITKI